MAPSHAFSSPSIPAPPLPTLHPPFTSSHAFRTFFPTTSASLPHQPRLITPPPCSWNTISCHGNKYPGRFPLRPKAVQGEEQTLNEDIDVDVDVDVDIESSYQRHRHEPRREQFPADFLFGFATSSFQWEGALYEGGRGLSIWDTFSQIPGKIKDGSVAAIGCNGYDKYKEDIQKIKNSGANAFRISLSWSRLLPDGKNINPEGLSFYNRVINEIVRQDLTPLVTLYHWDMPLSLENDPQVLGWRKKEIVNYFKEYANTCFKHFGDRVKYWMTFNEIYSFSIYGYGYGVFAPGRCSKVSGGSCAVGDSSTEPYQVTHNVLLAHAAAAHVYRKTYQTEQKGQIGVANCSTWFEPYDKNSTDDQEAVQRCLEFQTAWFWDPIFFGDYPESMRSIVGDRLPKFTPEESDSLKGSIDFLGINYYFANYARNSAPIYPSWWLTDTNAVMSVYGPDGKPIGELFGTTTPLMPVCPWGLRRILVWLTNRYGSELPIYITENGCSDNPELSPLDDKTTRIKFFREHLQNLATAINKDKCNVKGYIIWSILDNWEWSSGYTARFGCYYTDYGDSSNRVPKSSVAWLTKFLTG